MRFSVAYLSKYRARPEEPVPFKPMLNLTLRDRVSGKGAKTSEVCCIYEMSVMFSCFKDNEFQQKLCGKEVEAFQKCYMGHISDKKERTDREMKGILTPGEKNLTSKQLNKLLKKFPTL